MGLIILGGDNYRLSFGSSNPPGFIVESEANGEIKEPERKICIAKASVFISII